MQDFQMQIFTAVTFLYFKTGICIFFGGKNWHMLTVYSLMMCVEIRKRQQL